MSEESNFNLNLFSLKIDLIVLILT